ncbi:MAG: hydantoinase/carbamoylase family amidase [Hyphomicrobiales bacterium]|nr:hydantoinase/carbamoylase family amidase [Hyphomicrobiales bacterium]
MAKTNYPRINAERLWQRHMEMAKLGATAGGGVHRLALGDEDIAAHKLLAEWANLHGFAVELDAIGNMFIRREGGDASLPPVASGSHTDTQPMGGRFDGITGVLAAFEALETIHEAGVETRLPVEAIAWNNEEGPRFTPACMGSATYAGVEPLAEMLAREDADGITMGECVERLKQALPQAGTRALGAPLTSFLEVHIEQGIELETSGNTIGVVTGMQGYRRFAVEVTGDEAHSGTTPRARRKDAFVAATDMTHALREALWDDEDRVRFTIGRFEVLPGGISVVPGKVKFVIDLRHADAEPLKALGDSIPEICQAHAHPCAVTTSEFISQDPMTFPEEMVSRLEAAADRRGYTHQRIYSYAGHDARHMARACPAGMVFIPCWQGISHNEAERAEPEDIAAAAQIIADMLIDLANE